MCVGREREGCVCECVLGGGDIVDCRTLCETILRIRSHVHARAAPNKNNVIMMTEVYTWGYNINDH